MLLVKQISVLLPPRAGTFPSSVLEQDFKGPNYWLVAISGQVPTQVKGINADYRLLLYKQGNAPHTPVYMQ